MFFIVSTDPSFLHLPCCHDDDPCFLLPHHLPEVVDGCQEAPLGGNEDLVIIGPQRVLHSIFNEECKQKQQINKRKDTKT